MTHKHGAYLGGIRDLNTLRDRCVIDGECWHLRSARGKAAPKGGGLCIRVHLHGFKHQKPATRVAWFLKTGEWPRRDRYVTRVCDSHDCVNPEHLRAYTRKQQVAFFKTKGMYHSHARKVAAAKSGARASKLTQEQRMAVVNADSIREGAQLVGISEGYAAQIRRDYRNRWLGQLKLEAA